jgi:hypothetical protein
MLGFGRQSQPYIVVAAIHAVVMAKARLRRKANQYMSSGCHVMFGSVVGRKRPKVQRQYLHFAGHGYIC